MAVFALLPICLAKQSAELLQTTLDEESKTNEILNKLAESIVNPEALRENGASGRGFKLLTSCF